ncbi:MAG: hypothetical protein JNK05_21255 [Myxococcales bacterium]|nr:hypothetical protein [Myxococcales bacterium]
MSSAARTIYQLAARDLVALACAREDYDDHLEPFARRRHALYSQPQSPLWDGLYWPGFAQSLAAVGPAQWMPMAAVVEQGVTLEGGAKGLRGLFTKEPSEKERRRVQKTATLAGRILEMVANADRTLSPDEARLVAMAMNSFGLTAEELAQVRPGRALTFEDLEIFGDLDIKTRRALLRGAWQLAAASTLDPARDLAVRGVAARLELQHEADAIRAEVLAAQLRQSELAFVCVELGRSAARLLPYELVRPHLLHLLSAVAPPPKRAELEAHMFSSTPVQLGALPKLDSTRKRQALCAIFATLVAHDPPLSTMFTLRVRLTDDAIAAGCGSEVNDALEQCQRFLHERVREATATGQPAEVAVVTVAQVEAPKAPPAAPPAEAKPAPEVEATVEEDPLDQALKKR